MYNVLFVQTIISDVLFILLTGCIYLSDTTEELYARDD